MTMTSHRNDALNMFETAVVAQVRSLVSLDTTLDQAIVDTIMGVVHTSHIHNVPFNHIAVLRALYPMWNWAADNLVLVSVPTPSSE